MASRASGGAYMSDPVLGQVTLDEAEFAKEFKGAVLAIWPSYVTGDYFSGLSVIRDPIAVNRMLGSLGVLAIQSPMFSPAPK